MSRFSAVLLDLGGVLFIGDTPLGGSVEAVARLREAGIAVRFLTNSTRRPLRGLLAKLRHLGVEVVTEEIFTPAIAARRALAGRPAHLLVHPDLREDFCDDAPGEPEVVVVGDAGETFSYDNLNAAFRVLDGGADLFALAKSRAFREADGLSLDAGPFVAALEYASGREAQVIGKPAKAFFEAALASLDVAAADAVMVGDDAESDIGGALAAGLSGVLVRTGKYKDGDERKIDPAPTYLADDLAAAVDWILDVG